MALISFGLIIGLVVVEALENLDDPNAVAGVGVGLATGFTSLAVALMTLSFASV